MVGKASSKRIAKVFTECKGTDAIILVNGLTRDPNFTYLTEFGSGIFEGSILVAVRPNKLHLMTSILEYDTAVSEKQKNMGITVMKSSKQVKAELSRFLRGKRVGVNASILSMRLYKYIKKLKPKSLDDVSEKLLAARMIKDDGEIRKIKKASDITKAAMREIRKYFKKGVTELELAARFNYIMYEKGATGLAFDTIVAFGKNAAYPHHMPDNSRLKEGEVVLIDAGAKFENYCADVSRTEIFKPEKSKDIGATREMLATVLEAQKAAIKAIKPGRIAADIHNIAANTIDTAHKGIYKGKFIHALGHSVGIEVHDGEGFSPGVRFRLKPGMVITAEPGIYLVGSEGARFEDDVLVTEHGCKVL